MEDISRRSLIITASAHWPFLSSVSCVLYPVCYAFYPLIDVPTCPIAYWVCPI